MKKNILFMMTLLLSTLWAQAARDWNPPSGNQYPSHAVVYTTLFDASGQEVDNVADMRVGRSSMVSAVQPQTQYFAKPLTGGGISTRSASV